MVTVPARAAMPHNQYANYSCGSPKQRASMAWGLYKLTRTSSWRAVAWRERIGKICGKQWMTRTAGDTSLRFNSTNVCMSTIKEHWCMCPHKPNTYQALLKVKPRNLSFSIMVKKMSKVSWHFVSMHKCEASASHFIISFMFPISIGRGAQRDYKGARILSEKLLYMHYVWVLAPTRVYSLF